MKIIFICEREYPIDILKGKIIKTVKENYNILAPKNGVNITLHTKGLVILLDKEKEKVKIVDYVFTDKEINIIP